MIIIFEPQCIGFEHAEFNSAFIKVVKKAFNDEILFIAEKEHIKNVKNLLSDVQISYREVEVPPKEDADWERSRREFRLTGKVFELASSRNCRDLIFSSLTSPTLIAAKFLLRRYKDIRVLAVPHIVLDSITSVPRSRNVIFWLRIWLKLFNTPRLRYLLLGKTIQDELLGELPELEPYTSYIDHPYIFKGHEEIEDHRPNGEPKVLKNRATENYSSKPGTAKEDKITFGFLGVGYRKKGIEDFIRLSDDVKSKLKSQKENASFVVVGHVPEGEVNIKTNENSLLVASKTPLEQEDYEEYMEKIDYAMFLHKPTAYRFAASGVFFDAVSYLKPIIAIENPLFQYYFDLMGDIGYLCRDYGEVKDLVLNLIEKQDKRRYNRQRLNLKRGQEKMSLDRIAEKLRGVWSD